MMTSAVAGYRDAHSRNLGHSFIPATILSSRRPEEAEIFGAQISISGAENRTRFSPITH
jgi:hypothetical protein